MTEDLEAMSVPDLRRRRDAVRDREAALSYRRRLLQAQMDIVDQLGRDDEGDLETRIGHAITDAPSGRPEQARAVDLAAHPELDVAQLPLGLAGYDAAQRATLLASLAEDERATSGERRALLDELDELQSQLVQRYRTDGVDALGLLAGDGA